MPTFTVIKEDLSLYFIAVHRLVPIHTIGISEEKLAKEMLEIIAGLQANKPRGNTSKPLRERAKP